MTLPNKRSLWQNTTGLFNTLNSALRKDNSFHSLSAPPGTMHTYLQYKSHYYFIVFKYVLLFKYIILYNIRWAWLRLHYIENENFFTHEKPSNVF